MRSTHPTQYACASPAVPTLLLVQARQGFTATALAHRTRVGRNALACAPLAVSAQAQLVCPSSVRSARSVPLARRCHSRARVARGWARWVLRRLLRAHRYRPATGLPLAAPLHSAAPHLAFAALVPRRIRSTRPVARCPSNWRAAARRHSPRLRWYSSR